MSILRLADFPVQSYDKLRYADTDRQGHINNAVFSTFFETGRVELLHMPEHEIFTLGRSFVIVSKQISLRKEVHWPGTVEIGTGVMRIGNSSVEFYQQLFQHGECVATAQSVIVQVDDETGKSAQLSEEAKAKFAKWLLPPAANANQ